MKSKYIRSPLFYVGDKYKLMPQLNKLFPANINNFYDVFCGGGSVSLNSKAKTFHLNDINNNIMDLHKLLHSYSLKMEDYVSKAKNLSLKYGLSISEDYEYEEIEILKKKHKKTYFAIYNKKYYLQLREDYNKNQKNVIKLYLLLVYGFNHMIRFNNSGIFNLPVGNVDWNKNVTNALLNYGSWAKNNKINYSALDYIKFISSQDFEKNDFLYFDPPYLISSSEYNKLWSDKEEKELYDLLDKLDEKGIKWGLSNMLLHKNNENKMLKKWIKKYNVYEIESNYISRFDNSIKKNSKEVYITNYLVELP